MPILSYLKFSLVPDADLQDFESDLRAMLSLAERQPGYRWTEMGPSLTDASVYVIVSEWEDVERIRAWEHVEEHEGIADKWEPFYREALVHQRFVAWLRPVPADAEIVT